MHYKSTFVPVVSAASFGAMVLAFSGAALAQTGVSEDRVSLPEGPGSLEGIGENVEINTNMGAMGHAVQVRVPAGFGAVTPNLTLSYSSNGGESVVGVGWSIPMPSVERMTFKRLPLYQSDDDFCANGSDQLIRQPGTEPAIYRSRFEKGFVRYTWMAEGDGTEGYWIAEYPDGTKAYFGATAGGVLVPEARVGGDEGTFKYMMVEKVDVYGHREVWNWQKFGNYSLPTSIGYVFKGGLPTYEVEFTYEERRDDDDIAFISSADGGFNLLLTQRLAQIDVKSRGNRIRSYVLSYEPYRNSGGFTRLTRVETIGARDGLYPIVHGFEYSQALGGLCDGGDCTQPFMVDMGATGVTLANGSANLIDINGDALPDIIDASQPGAHRFFINEAREDGTSGFMPESIPSAIGSQSGHRLGQATVQVLDVNGDGFTDLINASTGSVLINKGNGDWEATSSVQSNDLAEALAEDFDPGEGGLQSLRFIDFNNDKLIDMMRATRAQTVFFENRGEDGFEVVDGTTAIEAGFEEDNLQLSDMNGDGQLDIVKMQLGSIQYRLNFGWGKWGDWIVIDGLPIGEGQIELAEMEDINGDALADLVVVVGESVTYALNNNSTEFEAPVTLTSDDVTGSIPNRGQEVTVLYADMNANGSSDVVWIGLNGQVDYLELFPVRPNLMTRITNGIGKVTDIAYTTVAIEMARDGGAGAWQYRIPSPMNVVKSTDKFDLLTELHEITEYTYRDGFYDGIEKQFRGFERVQTRLVGDDTIEEGLTEEVYDVGATDTYRNGLLLQTAVSSGGRMLSETVNTYEDCPVAELAEDLRFPVKHVCMSVTRTTSMEGLEEARWIATRSASTYDGYGNVTLQSDFGIESVGGGACAPCGDRGQDDFGAPCGPQCVGDEMFTRTDYVTTDNTSGRWIIGAPFRVQTFGRNGTELATERLTYYDGDAFVGLSLGQLDQGKLTRSTARISPDSDAVIEVVRNKFDRHGNVIETLDPLGVADGTTHRRIFEMDEENLRVVQADVLLEDSEGNPYSLRRELTYEPLFDKPLEATDWLRTVNDNIVSTVRGFGFTHDEFGRLTERFLPGNTTPNPDEAFEYDLGLPTTRLITRKRSEVGGPLDLAVIDCLDGRGRSFQVRTQIDANTFRVSGFQRYNIKSEVVEEFQPYTSNSAQCDTAPPEGTRSVKTRYDAIYRPIQTTQPDAELYGEASVARMVYEPFATVVFDHEDSDPSSPHFETPTVTHFNGLGAVVGLERTLERGAQTALTQVHYNGLGHLTGYTDPNGHRKEQSFDLLGRATVIVDPNSAEDTRMTFDAASNVVRQVDDRGVVTINVFDGMNRKVATYDEANELGTRIDWRYDFDANCPDCTHAEGKAASIRYPGIEPGQGAEDRFGYDLRGRSTLMSRTLAGVQMNIGMGYDNANRVISTTFPDGNTVERAYDGAYRLTSIPDVVHTVSYDGRSQMDGIGCADGTATTMTYDALMRLSQRTTGGATGLIQGFAYQHDRMGNILTIEDLAEAVQGGPNFDATHAYDAWYRVTSSRFEGDLAETIDFAFNAIDNITDITSSLGAASPAHVGAMAYDSFAPNALTEAGGAIIDYDKNGNVSARGDQTYTWDFMNRMTAAEGAGSARFVYGSDQSRVAKLEGDQSVLYTFGTFEVRDGIATTYILVDNMKAARRESVELATAFYEDRTEDGIIGAGDALLNHAEGGESGPELWSSVRRLLVETGPDDGITFLHHDHLGSITLATGQIDGEQVVLGHRGFNPLGTERRDGFGYVDEYGFTGQEIDRSTGLIHFDWRYLDPRTGRWLSIDPAFGTSNTSNIVKHGEATTGYAYVTGNFINATDPTGLKTSLKAKMLKVLKKDRKSGISEVKKLAKERKALSTRLERTKRKAEFFKTHGGNQQRLHYHHKEKRLQKELDTKSKRLVKAIERVRTVDNTIRSLESPRPVSKISSPERSPRKPIRAFRPREIKPTFETGPPPMAFSGSGYGGFQPPTRKITPPPPMAFTGSGYGGFTGR